MNETKKIFLKVRSRFARWNSLGLGRPHFIFFLCFAWSLSGGCHNKTLIEQAEGIRYFSDYFVFISDDVQSPLIVPLDINWEPRADRKLFVELKAWTGRPHSWPFHYAVVRPTTNDFPRVFAQLPKVGGMVFSQDLLTVQSANIQGLQVGIPSMKSDEGFTRISSAGRTVFRAARTKVRFEGRTIPGRIIWEHLRFRKFVKEENDQGMFSRFFWFPISTGQDFYLVVSDGSGKPFALHWVDKNGLNGPTPPMQGKIAQKLADYENWSLGPELTRVKETKKVELVATSYSPEKKSGRTKVPSAWNLRLPELGFQASFRTVSHHTGYGPAKASGRALYRQGLISGHTGKGAPMVGMVEMILED